MISAFQIDSEPEAVLGVNCSLGGCRWVGPSQEEDRFAQAIAQGAGLPDLIARVLARRGVTAGGAEAYLRPTLRDLMPDPSSLLDMDKAAARIWRAAEHGERIAIFADYDVDGGASAALLLHWLRALGRDATLYVPDRIKEGYGPNEAAMRTLGAAHDLIVCVDCGTLSHGPIAVAGVDVVVLDHHQGGETLPSAVAVVNPNRQDESRDLGYLCAAGVVFMLLVAVGRIARKAGREAPDLLNYLDLVALATISDVAPLTGLNRAFVRAGLKIMRSGLKPGLAALAEVGRLAGPPGVHALGFVFGPRINAGGRVGAADLGARLLASADPHEAAALAERLDRLNGERKDVEASVRAAAEAQVESRGVTGPLIWAAGEGWHPGVVGIVAARLKEAYGRPAVVIGFEGHEGKGSGRSTVGVDLGTSVATLVREGLISKGGGHAMAAGLSLTRANLEPAMERLCELLARQGAGNVSGATLSIDAILGARTAGPDLCEVLEAAGPFGAASPRPRIAMPRMRVLDVRRVGDSHLSVGLADEEGGRLAGIAFRCAGTTLGAALGETRERLLHVAGQLELDTWGGRRRAKLCIEDAAFAS